jgi:hypothetical protein
MKTQTRRFAPVLYLPRGPVATHGILSLDFSCNEFRRTRLSLSNLRRAKCRQERNTLLSRLGTSA